MGRGREGRQGEHMKGREKREERMERREDRREGKMEGDIKKTLLFPNQKRATHYLCITGSSAERRLCTP